MSSSSTVRIARIAAVGALFAALGLAGCGRKGGLDAPPASSAVDERVVAAQSGTGPEIRSDGPPPEALVAPPRRTPLDWLID